MSSRSSTPRMWFSARAVSTSPAACAASAAAATFSMARARSLITWRVRLQSSIEHPARPVRAASRTVSAVPAASSAKPSSRSALTGSPVAPTSVAACASASSRVTSPSRRPSVAACPELVVANARKPRKASVFAVPTSQALPRSSGSGPACRARKSTLMRTTVPRPRRAPRLGPLRARHRAKTCTGLYGLVWLSSPAGAPPSRRRPCRARRPAMGDARRQRSAEAVAGPVGDGVGDPRRRRHDRRAGPPDLAPDPGGDAGDRAAGRPGRARHGPGAGQRARRRAAGRAAQSRGQLQRRRRQRTGVGPGPAGAADGPRRRHGHDPGARTDRGPAHLVHPARHLRDQRGAARVPPRSGTGPCSSTGFPLGCRTTS